MFKRIYEWLFGVSEQAEEIRPGTIVSSGLCFPENPPARPVIKYSAGPVTGRTQSGTVNYSNVPRLAAEPAQVIKREEDSGPSLLTTYLVYNALTSSDNESKQVDNEPACYSSSSHDYGSSDSGSSYDSCSSDSSSSSSSDW